MRESGSCDDLAEVVGNPCGRQGDVFAEGFFFLLAELLPELGDDLRGDEVLAHETEGLGDEAADFSRHSHHARRGLAEDDFLVADLDDSLIGIGEEFRTGGDLIAESQEVGSICSGGLEA